MGIGAIGSSGGIGAMYGTSYIYNPNRVSAKSLDKVNKISDDVLDGKLDVQNDTPMENTNPLKMGETQNFEALLEEQMYMGMSKAAQLFGFL